MQRYQPAPERCPHLQALLDCFSTVAGRYELGMQSRQVHRRLHHRLTECLKLYGGEPSVPMTLNPRRSTCLIADPSVVDGTLKALRIAEAANRQQRRAKLQ